MQSGAERRRAVQSGAERGRAGQSGAERSNRVEQRSRETVQREEQNLLPVADWAGVNS